VKIKVTLFAVMLTFGFAAAALAGAVTVHFPVPPLPPLPPPVVVEPEPPYPPLPPTVVITPGPPAYWFWSPGRRMWFYYDVDRRPIFVRRHRFVDDGRHFFSEGGGWRIGHRDEGLHRGWYGHERREHRRDWREDRREHDRGRGHGR